MSKTASTCERVLADVSAYLDGELGAAACRTLQRHCLDCERCAALVADLRQTVGLCQDAGERPVPAHVRRRARDEVRRLLAGLRD